MNGHDVIRLLEALSSKDLDLPVVLEGEGSMTDMATLSISRGMAEVERVLLLRCARGVYRHDE